MLVEYQIGDEESERFFDKVPFEIICVTLSTSESTWAGTVVEGELLLRAPGEVRLAARHRVEELRVVGESLDVCSVVVADAEELEDVGLGLRHRPVEEPLRALREARDARLGLPT